LIASEFEFFAPKQLSEALDLLERCGDGARVMAGGMSLVPLMSVGLAHPDTVVSLNHVDGLDIIAESDGALRIGALTRHHTLCVHPTVARCAPLLAEAAACIGDAQIRNRGTLGGSLAHADPAADYLGVTLALGARFRVQKAGGERWIEAADFFTDVMVTALEPGEVLTEIEVPTAPPGSAHSHQRLCRVEGAFPIVAASIAIESGLGRARLGLGGVGPRPVRLDIAPLLVEGASAGALAAIGEAARDASHGALADLHGGAEYRREMASVFARRAVRVALEQL